MKKVVFLLVFPLILFSQKNEGQSVVDSLIKIIPNLKNDSTKVNLLNKIAFEYQNFDNSKGVLYGKEALNLSKKINFKKGISIASKNIGINLSIQSKYKEANVYYDLALKNTTNKSIICDIYRTIAVDYTEQGNLNKALEYNLKALTLAEAINDVDKQGSSLVNIGVIYSYLEKFDLAITYHLKSIEKFEKTNNLEKIALVRTYLADCYFNKNQTGKALNEYKISEKILVKSGNIIFLEKVLNSIANVYLERKETKKALEYTSRSLEINKKTLNKYNLSVEETTLGEIYFSLGCDTITNSKIENTYLTSAITHINNAIKLKKDIGEVTHLADLYRILSTIQTKRNEHKEALISYKYYVTYRDSIFNSENKESLKNIEFKREIEVRDNKLKINNLLLIAQQKQKWLYFSGLGFLSIIGGLLFYQSRKSKKTNKKLQLLNQNLDEKIILLDNANKSKIRFFTILNHDLRRPISNLIDFLQIKKNSPDLLDKETKIRLETSTLSSAENLLISMEDMLLWSKSQMENFKPQPAKTLINFIFEDIKTHFLSEEKVQFVFENNQNIELITDENYLKTIIRNLTQNAIKAVDTLTALSETKKPIIIWKAWQNENQTFLSITDNGKGANSEQFKALYDENEVVGIKSGLGLHLIRDLAKAINCEILVDSKENSGTTFTLKL